MKPQITPSYRVKVVDPITGKVKKREGRPVWRIHGYGPEYAGKGVWLHLGWNISVHIPEGFESDLASRPTIRSPGLFMKLVGLLLMPVPDSWWEAAAMSAGFHDVLCEHPEVPRSTADGIFWAAMHLEGVPPVWRDLLFRSVTFSNSKESHNDPAIFNPVGADPQPSLFDPRPGA